MVIDFYMAMAPKKIKKLMMRRIKMLDFKHKS